MRLLLFLFILPSLTFAKVECPEGATRLEVTLPTDGSVVEFCQKNFMGKLLKHGPYKKTTADGVVLEESYYTEGQLGREAPVKKVTKKEENPCKVFKRDITRFLNPVSNKEEGTHRRVVTNKELCAGYPRERLMFIVTGAPFNMTWKFKKKCFAKGTLKWIADKKSHARFDTVPPFTVDSIEFDYLMTRNGSGNTKGFILKVTNGVMKKKGKEGQVKFSFEQSVNANLIDLKTSRGREGLFTEEPTVKVTEAFGRKC